MALSALGDNPYSQVLNNLGGGVLALDEGNSVIDLSGLVSGPEGLQGLPAMWGRLDRREIPVRLVRRESLVA